ncbi:MAG: TIR domain-containing protein [Clostridia bacterium]|nr:TIR domain-containing protein [Clostridia bacterium]
MKKPYVFISYSTKDSDIANLVLSYLEGNGINCWIASQNIEGGDSFAMKIVDAIEGCAAFVLIASENSNDSPHVSREMSLAAGKDKKIIPFRIEEYTLSKNNVYFLQLSQWISAEGNVNGALKHLLAAIRTELPEEIAEPEPVTIKTKVSPSTSANTDTHADDSPSLSREEIVNLLLQKIEKFPYCLKDKTWGANYDNFKRHAQILFASTLSMSFRGKPTAAGIDYVDIIVDTLQGKQGSSIQVRGLPGCAKNMLIQLAYYKMLENFLNGTSDCLPVYLSSSYYEKQPYTRGKEREEMTELIREELKEYFSFISQNPKVRPILMLEAVREHVVSSFAPEDVILKLWQNCGKFSRIIAVDVGLVKNRLRLKRAIPLLGDTSGYAFNFHSLPITDKELCLPVIRAILDMYIDEYDDLNELDVYRALVKLKYEVIDIFSIRLVATELTHGCSIDSISLVDMYERLAITEVKGDASKLLEIAKELYSYVYDESARSSFDYYNAVMWSLPHKHNTYLEFLIAYYFTHAIGDFDKTNDYDILNASMTEMENLFISSSLKDSYPLQKPLLDLVLNNYSSFNYAQKCTAAYWLGKLTYAELSEKAKVLLESEYKRLKPVVKTNNSGSLANKNNHRLFRSVCLALIAHGCTDILDEYLCLIVINDIANAINRGAVVQYMGDGFSTNLYNELYLDTDLKLGEQPIRILCSRVESKLMEKRHGFVETNLVSLLTLVQARMHVQPEKLPYNLGKYAAKCLELLEKYYTRPRSIVSDKLHFYFMSISDDLRHYVGNYRSDVAFTLYKDLSIINNRKRSTWQNYGIEEPESYAEHTLGAWMMAIIFLPEECDIQGYNKSEILDMLLIHDMADAVLNKIPQNLAAPDKDLKEQNDLIRKMFLKGTSPEVANMTYYYNIWTGYYNCKSINARIARDINLIQTVDTFFTHFSQNPDKFSLETVREWLDRGSRLGTDIGYDLFDRIIAHNSIYRKAVDDKVTSYANSKI